MMQAANSPKIAWPLILPFIEKPTSAVDFGCGTGHWLAELKRQVGAIDVLGVNSPDRPDGGVELPKECFAPSDLTKPISLGRTFDFAICIEVAEHLPPQAADQLIETISIHANQVLFSGAIPGQGGENHLNEQWPNYWIEKFSTRGFSPADVLRPLIWDNPGISLWYRQNLMLFFRPPKKFSSRDWGGAGVVHPDYFLNWHTMNSGRRALLKGLLRRPTRMPLSSPRS